ncbi:MAG: HEAT repeat domain-containing protein, partial [Chloroflexota bacterium]
MEQATFLHNISQAFAGFSFVQTIATSLIDQTLAMGTGIIGAELAERFSSLRGQQELNQQLGLALERAAERWALDHPDRNLVLAVSQSTTLITPSVHDAIVDFTQHPFSDHAKERLTQSWREVLPRNFDERRLAEGTTRLVTILREEFTGVPVLREALQVWAAMETARNTQDAAYNTDAINHKLDALIHLIEAPSPTEATRTHYLNWVIDQHRYLDPRGTMQTVRQVQVLLQEVYVSLMAEPEQTLDVRDRRLFEHELEAMLAEDGLREEEIEDRRENLWARYEMQEHMRHRVEEVRKSTQPMELSELVREQAQLVILGDPGAGKTTLLRYLALNHALAIQQGNTEIDKLGPTRLPLYMRIANYAEHGKGTSLLEFLPLHLDDECNGNEMLAKLVETELAAGTCLVLLDGLDEIIEPSQRAEIAQQINSFIRHHERAGNRFVITSRVAGYRTAPLSGDMAHYRVRDMDMTQIERFLHQWCHAIERFQTPELGAESQNQKAETEITSITHAIEENPGVRRLATNPLLLRVIALIHRTGARLPQRRIELYRLAAETLIRDWQLSRGVPQAALVHEAEATRLLSELAAWMHQERPAGIATISEIRYKLAEVKARLAGKEEDDPEILVAVDDFIERIRQHTGLFVERAPRRYGFMHLTFEEYFAARWLVARPRQAARRIRQKLHRPRWDEPILLAIGFYGMDFPDDVDDLVEEALLGEGLGGPSPYEDILQRDLLFAVRTLGDQNVGDSLCRRLVTGFVDLWVDDSGSGKYASIRRQLEKITPRLKGSSASELLVKMLANILSNSALSGDKRSRAASALSNATLNEEAVMALIQAMQDGNSNVRSRTALALSNAALDEGVETVLIQAMLNENEEDVRSHIATRLSHFMSHKTSSEALLASLLEDKDVHTRNFSSRDKASAALLTSLLEDKDVHIRRNIALAFGNTTLVDVTVNGLIDALKRDEDLFVRWNIVETLNIAKLSESAILALTQALNDGEGSIRLIAVEALRANIRYETTITTLISTLQDDNEHVRLSVVEALKNVANHDKVVLALIDTFKDISDDVRQSAVDTLSNINLSKVAILALIQSLKDENSSVRESAAIILGSTTNHEGVVMALIDALNDDNEDVRSSATSALSNAINYENAIIALIQMLKDNCPDVSWSAALALSNATNHRGAMMALIESFKDSNEDVRLGAVSALRNAMLNRIGVEYLLNALNDNNDDVRWIAALALKRNLHQKSVITALVQSLRDKNDLVRWSAATSLSGATKHKSVVTALIQRLHSDNDIYIRRVIVHILSDVTYDEDVVTALIQTVCNGTEDIRWIAALALQNATFSEKSTLMLVQAITPYSAFLRWWATTVLNSIILSETAVMALLEKLTDDSKEVHLSVITSLNNSIYHEEAVRFCIQALKN